jgi:glucose/arabinose dehydrogenase
MSRGRLIALAGALAVVAATAVALAGRDDDAVTQVRGFRDTVVLRGLDEPLALAFAPDGRVFIGEKGGTVKVAELERSGSVRVVAELGSRVFTAGDRGLFGLALDPEFPARPFVYVLYTFDGPVDAKMPLGRRRCPGLFEGACPVSGRVSRLAPDGGERVLVAGWCQQYPSHGVGDLAFGADGTLYASGGEGASYDRVDEGRRSDPCGDPPREGGALRAQDLGSARDPAGVSGSVIAIDPETWAHRVVAYGLRNPFRFALRSRTELWIGDVGSTRADELDVADASAPVPVNFGWPCYEGASPLRSYDEADIPLCEELYDEESATDPFAVLDRDEELVDGDRCGRDRQALSGLAFYEGVAYPARYRGALFLTDFVRRCLWAMLLGVDGRPDPDRLELVRRHLAAPVDLVAGPGGDLFYLDFAGGALHRLTYTR